MTQMTTKPLIDIEEVQRAYTVLVKPEQVIELRALEAVLVGSRSSYPQTLAGYFDNVNSLVTALRCIQQALGIYITIHELDPNLLHRAKNKIVKQKKDYSTPDKNVLRYRWIPLDCDIVRSVKLISSSDEEHDQALAHAQKVKQYLQERGFPEPIEADSGNGAHLLLPVDLPTTAENIDLVERVLKGIASATDNSTIKVDQMVKNPARIWKLYGTLACKGDDTEERPHRMARLLSVPPALQMASLEQLESIACPKEEKQTPIRKARPASKSGPTLEEYLHAHAIGYHDVTRDGILYHILDNGCVFDPEHKGNDAAVFVAASGKWSYHCFHESCGDQHWQDFRLKIEPDAYNKKSGPEKNTQKGEEEINEEDNEDYILITDQNRDIQREVYKYLRAYNDKNKVIYVHAQNIVVLGRDRREHDKMMIMPQNAVGICNLVTHAANVYALGKKNPRTGKCPLLHAALPKRVAEEILTHPPGMWPFPALRGIVETPIIRPDGTIFDTPGYDKETCLFYNPSASMRNCHIPDTPTDEDVKNALALLHPVLDEFSYDNDCSRANAYGAVLTPLTRMLYGGDVQIDMISASKQGTGKGLLADVIHITTTGRSVSSVPFAEKEEEFKKVLDSAILVGETLFVIDNIKRKFRSSSLDALTTGKGRASIRPLGLSKFVSVETQMQIIATGNNIQMDRDMARRCLFINLIPETSNPEGRDDFTIMPLEKYVLEHRAEIVQALLTFVRAWFVAGKPVKKKRVMGTFTEWSTTIGAILDHIGIDGFQDNREGAQTEANTDEYDMERFLLYWHDALKDEYKPAKDIVEKLISTKSPLETDSTWFESLPEYLIDILGDDKKKPSSKVLSFTKMLQKNLRTPYGASNIRIEQKQNRHQKIVLWRVFIPQKKEKTPPKAALQAGQDGTLAGVLPNDTENLNTTSDGSTSGLNGIPCGCSYENAGVDPLPANEQEKNIPVSASLHAKGVDMQNIAGVSGAGKQPRQHPQHPQKSPSDSSTSGSSPVFEHPQETSDEGILI